MSNLREQALEKLARQLSLMYADKYFYHSSASYSDAKDLLLFVPELALVNRDPQPLTDNFNWVQEIKD